MQSLTPQQEAELTSRMANIIARGADAEVIEDNTPKVNVSNPDAGATPEMREALAQMPGSNSKAEFMAKNNMSTDIRVSNKPQIDNRTEWERDQDRAADLRTSKSWLTDAKIVYSEKAMAANPKLRGRNNKNWDRDAYIRNLPTFEEAKRMTQKDWSVFSNKFGEPVHYDSETKGR